MNCMDMKGMDMKGMDMKGMDMKGMNMDCPDMSKKPAADKQSTHMAKGVVKKINAKTGMVTVAHEPVQSMNWPAMTMDFKVKDKMLLKKFADGKDVEFEFAKEGSGYVVKSVK
ncbi:copper-binding protein [Variovorax sp. RA8]|uniref:copper-binding protein n=1 Tax=Variovorax sp. (strain JCM 16519 / RA8) TaxID=662548 RepID=UPI000A5C2798|nr:copper-binding protein [Variovorax sp. RA8]VTU42384.1 Cation efflux system protein CusF precursor [Variovorax sp. RA8]